MPATKKKKVIKSNVQMEKKVTKISEQMNMLLFVFSLAMLAFAYVLYTVYVN